MTFSEAVFNNPVVHSYILYASACLFKMVLITWWTAYFRITRKIVSNPEDSKVANVKVGVDEDVERTRRCHLNDLENIPLFVFIGAFYVMTDPSATVALWHFRLFTIGRYLHTAGYMSSNSIVRVLGFETGLFTTVSMIVQIFIAFAF